MINDSDDSAMQTIKSVSKRGRCKSSRFFFTSNNVTKNQVIVYRVIVNLAVIYPFIARKRKSRKKYNIFPVLGLYSGDNKANHYLSILFQLMWQWHHVNSFVCIHTEQAKVRLKSQYDGRSEWKCIRGWEMSHLEFVPDKKNAAVRVKLLFPRPVI